MQLWHIHTILHLTLPPTLLMLSSSSYIMMTVWMVSSYDTDGVALFQVKGSTPTNTVGKHTQYAHRHCCTVHTKHTVNIHSTVQYSTHTPHSTAHTIHSIVPHSTHTQHGTAHIHSVWYCTEHLEGPHGLILAWLSLHLLAPSPILLYCVHFLFTMLLH